MILKVSSNPANEGGEVPVVPVSGVKGSVP